MMREFFSAKIAICIFDIATTRNTVAFANFINSTAIANNMMLVRRITIKHVVISAHKYTSFFIILIRI